MVHIEYRYVRYLLLATTSLTFIFIMVALNSCWIKTVHVSTCDGFKTQTLTNSTWLFKTCYSDCVYKEECIETCTERSDIFLFKTSHINKHSITNPCDLDVIILCLLLCLLFCFLALFCNIIMVRMKRYNRYVYIQHAFFIALLFDLLVFTVIWAGIRYSGVYEHFATAFTIMDIAVVMGLLSVFLSVVSLWKRPRDDFDYDIMVNANGDEMNSVST